MRFPIAATVNAEEPTGRHPSNNLSLLHAVNIVETIDEFNAIAYVVLLQWDHPLGKDEGSRLSWTPESESGTRLESNLMLRRCFE